MSDEEEKAVPTAAYGVIQKERKKGEEHCIRAEALEKPDDITKHQFVDELVRRSDVVRLVENKFIYSLKMEIERIKAGDHSLEYPEEVLEHHKIQLNNFEELLEEIK